MKKFLPFSLMVFLFILAGCKKDENVPEPEIGYDVKVYTNTSGDPNADALIAHMENKSDHSRINFYGLFNVDNSPRKVRTVTFQKASNDTIVYFTLNDTTGNLETGYVSVNGTKQPWVVKHDYIVGNDHAVIISIYEYDWTQNIGTLRYKSTFENVNGTVIESPSFANFRTNDLLDWAAVAGGFVVAEAACYGSGVGFLGTAAGAALVGAVGPMVYLSIGVVALVVAIDYLFNPANAAQIVPGQYAYPDGTPIPNPTLNNNDPTPNLEPCLICDTTNIDFTGNMDSQGNIAVEGLSGGTWPYTYSLGFPLQFQSSQFFLGNYPAGNYWITVRDANNCTKSKYCALNQLPDDCIDIDGNVYQTVQIGNQIWMRENLKVTRYRNGDVIPTGLDDATWANTLSGACAIYNDNQANNTIYGKLYNWYAVNDSRGLCPVGWHIPSDSEWQTLIDNLGGDAVAGGAMKSTSSLWASTNVGATNSSGFSALPGGDRGVSQWGYYMINYNCYFWSATMYDNNLSHVRYLTNGFVTVYHSVSDKQSGFSCRCVKD